MPLLAQQVMTSYGLMTSVKLPVIQKNPMPLLAHGLIVLAELRVRQKPYAGSGATGHDLKCSGTGIAYLLSIEEA